jgi:DNA topoisomerase IB
LTWNQGYVSSEFWTWLDQDSKDHTEAMLDAATRERNVGTTTVTEDETMTEAGARESSNADTARVTQTETMGVAGARETSTVTASVTGNSTSQT